MTVKITVSVPDGDTVAVKHRGDSFEHCHMVHGGEERSFVLGHGETYTIDSGGGGTGLPPGG